MREIKVFHCCELELKRINYDGDVLKVAKFDLFTHFFSKSGELHSKVKPINYFSKKATFITQQIILFIISSFTRLEILHVPMYSKYMKVLPTQKPIFKLYDYTLCDVIVLFKDSIVDYKWHNQWEWKWHSEEHNVFLKNVTISHHFMRLHELACGVFEGVTCTCRGYPFYNILNGITFYWMEHH